jgi:cytochrome c oxidase assembly protein subunit 19
MNFSSSKQFVRPPQRGIFPLDHFSECKPEKETYLTCLKDSKAQHNKCREFSRVYLECRMENELMAKENLDDMGYSEAARVKEGTAKEYDKQKEKDGYIAGKHIGVSTMKYWWQK